MKRRGFHLTEVLIALVLAAGPLLVMFQLVQSNSRASRHLLDHATARHLLIELSDLLMAQPREELKATAAGTGALNRFVEMRLSAMPVELREPYLEQLKPFGGALACELTEDVSGMPGLARLKLSMRVPSGAAVSVLRYFRT